MSAAIHHLVSRGVEIAKNHDFHQQTFVFQLPTWGVVMLALTTVLFFLFSGAVRIPETGCSSAQHPLTSLIDPLHLR